MRSLPSKAITYPPAFKAISSNPYSRRAQLWNRQASVVTDLTVLAFRQGWYWVPVSAPAFVVPSAVLYKLLERFDKTQRLVTHPLMNT
jgi:hypothetical protein